ncbi:hypothetical protein PpBr36_02121 [Pyricularia pennisetigena]|uniref:hypothetical protein n=1 Tax=Pyricularia pennisetigena TaxID=1578925 RepID=UPI00114FA7EE|nr:hypothetical protein PpBr36_02121 [Pyricularia pennisetigena]TLS28391.1 hypothetical protein PpBr36_02121 [Pyricularia pennisetigena]
MGVAKKTRKFGAVKRMIGKRDERLKKPKVPEGGSGKAKAGPSTTSAPGAGEPVRQVTAAPKGLFFSHNENIVPPYNVLVDTSFITHTVGAKIELLEGLMDSMYATCRPIITDCVMAELEKLGPKYRIALRIARDERWERLKCDHKVYADDCLVDRAVKNRIYIVATNDRDLKRRIRKIPGVPIVTCGRKKYLVEGLPGAPTK